MYRIYDSLWTLDSPTSRGRGSVPRHLCKANNKEKEFTTYKQPVPIASEDPCPVQKPPEKGGHVENVGHWSQKPSQKGKVSNS